MNLIPTDIIADAPSPAALAVNATPRVSGKEIMEPVLTGEAVSMKHVIRNHENWDRIHRYIKSNPSIWAEDEENPMKS
jgi:hypothetical protein